MTELDDRLRRHLRQQATDFDLEAGSVRSVARRAQQRARRKRLGGMAVLAVTGVLAADRITAATGDDPTVTVMSPSIGDGAPLTWHLQQVPAAAALAMANHATVGADGALYALSTEPGRHGDDTAPASALYRSTDGITWAPASIGGAFGDLAASGGNLYTVATAPGTHGMSVGSVSVRSSGDGGASWADLALPIHLPSIEEGADDVYVTSTRVASVGSTVVATARVTARLDAAELGIDAPNGLGATLEGVEVYGAAADGDLRSANCVGGTLRPATADDLDRLGVTGQEAEEQRLAVLAAGGAPATVAPRDADGDLVDGGLYACDWGRGASDISLLDASEVHGGPTEVRPWADLDVSPDLVKAALAQVRVFSADGSSGFVEVELPSGPPAAWSGVVLEGTDDGFVLATVSPGTGGGARQPSTLRTFTSTDGQAWAEDPATSVSGWFPAVGTLGGKVVAVASHDDEGASLLTYQGGGWVTQPLTDGLDLEGQAGIGSVSFGQGGIAVVVHGWGDTGSTGTLLLTSRDGEVWTTTDLATVEGSPLAASDSTWVRDVTVSSTGVVVSFTQNVGQPEVIPDTTVLVGSF